MSRCRSERCLLMPGPPGAAGWKAYAQCRRTPLRKIVHAPFAREQDDPSRAPLGVLREVLGNSMSHASGERNIEVAEFRPTSRLGQRFADAVDGSRASLI